MKPDNSRKILILISSFLFFIFIALSVIMVVDENKHVSECFEDRTHELVAMMKADDDLMDFDSVNYVQDVEMRYLQDESMIDYMIVTDLDNNIVFSQDTTEIGNEYQTYNISQSINTFSNADQFDYKVVSSELIKDGVIKGYFIVGVDVEIITNEQHARRNDLLIIMSAALVVSLGCAYLINRKFQQDLLGFTSSEICLLYAENKSIIEQLNEAVISVDKNYKILTMNQRFLQMFDLSTDIIGEDVKEYFPDVDFEAIIKDKGHILDKYKKINNQKLLMNAFPLYQDDEIIGASAVFRSYLKVDTLLDQIKGYQEVSQALRSQKHEFQNKLHVVLGLIKIGDYKKAENYIMQNVYTTNLASDYYSSRIKDDRILALFVGKEIQSKEYNSTLLLTSDSYLSKSHYPINSDDIVLILGNLIDNSLEAYLNSDLEDKRVVVDLFEDENRLKITVVDQAGGINPKVIDRMFERGVSSKQGDSRGTGLSLVNEIVSVYNGEKNVLSSKEETKIEIILEKVTI